MVIGTTMSFKIASSFKWKHITQTSVHCCCLHSRWHSQAVEQGEQPPCLRNHSLPLSARWKKYFNSYVLYTWDFSTTICNRRKTFWDLSSSVLAHDFGQFSGHLWVTCVKKERKDLGEKRKKKTWVRKRKKTRMIKKKEKAWVRKNKN